MSPQRAKLAEALAYSRRARLTTTDAREAWEALCTALDLAGWVDDPRREFASPVVRVEEVGERELEGGTTVVTDAAYDAAGNRVLRNRVLSRFASSYDRSAPILLPYPPDVASCVAIASDAPGVLAAEAVAREITGRERVVWRVCGPGDADWQVGALIGDARPSVLERAPWDAAAARVGATARVADALAPLGYRYAPRADDDAVTLLCPALGAAAR